AEDVTLQQWRTLVVLSRQESVTATHLAEALGVHQSSTTRLCDRLVRKKLIKRVHREADRREIAVSLTATGRRLVDRVLTRRRRELRVIAARMTPEARQQALEGLRAFTEAAGEPKTDLDRFGWSEP
ncbi:MAG: MarR family transcriptional regulator, partial [Gemmatimonas sp.]|nr:MarR family transcriptional regulator [Gemmatimonas sp.]